jgi:hypothetical protein
MDFDISVALTTSRALVDQTEEADGDRARQREGWPAGKTKPPRRRPFGAAGGRLTHSLSDPFSDPFRREEAA